MPWNWNDKVELQTAWARDAEVASQLWKWAQWETSWGRLYCNLAFPGVSPPRESSERPERWDRPRQRQSGWSKSSASHPINPSVRSGERQRQFQQPLPRERLASILEPKSQVRMPRNATSNLKPDLRVRTQKQTPFLSWPRKSWPHD